MKAKELFALLFVISVVFCGSMRLNIDSSIIISPGQKVHMPIPCSGGQGRINMDAKGLPKGLVIQQGYLIGQIDATSGFFPVLIDARDEIGNFVSQILMIKIGKQLPGAQITVSNGQTIATTTINSLGSTTTSNPVNNLSVNNLSVNNLNSNTNGQYSSVGRAGIGNQVVSTQNSYNGAISGQNSQQMLSIPISDRQNTHNGIVTSISFTDINDSNAKTQNPMPFPASSTLQPTSINSPSIPSISISVSSPTSSATQTSPYTTSSIYSASTQTPHFSSLQYPSSAIATNDLNNLLGRLAPSTQTPINNRLVNPNVPLDKQSYPIPNLPTGTTANSPVNTVPIMIDKAQAARSQSYRNQPTADSVKTTAIFQRQLNANKAIANLLDIIDQLRANTNAAKADIPILQAQLKSAVAAQRTAQSKVIAAQTQKNRLTTAINSLNDNVNLLRSQLTQLDGSLKDNSQTILIKKNQQNTVRSLIQKNENSLKDIGNKISNQKQQISKTEAAINTKQDTIQKIKIQIDRKTKEVQNIDADIDGAVRNVKNIDEQIIDLKARVNAAINRKLLAEQEQQRLRSLKSSAPSIRTGLQTKVVEETQDFDKLLWQRQRLNSQLSKLNGQYDDLGLTLSRSRSQLSQIQTQINIVSGNKQNFDGTIAAKNKQISDALSNLQYLKNQISSYDNILRTAYNQGNDANGRVEVAKQNLQALIKKWERQSKQLSEATINLEKARAEKQLADLAMEQILRERSSVLPYSVVPNGNGITASGTPTGNNPRGSPLGPLQQNNYRGSNPYPEQTKKITDFSNYLSSAYANGVDPTKPSTTTRNFPFTIYQPINVINQKNSILGNRNIVYDPSGQQIDGALSVNEQGIPNFMGDFSCSNTKQTVSGVIKLIGLNALTVQTDTGKTVLVKIGSCSQARANIPNYSMRVGDKVNLSGERQIGSSNTFNLYDATCKCERC